MSKEQDESNDERSVKDAVWYLRRDLDALVVARDNLWNAERAVFADGVGHVNAAADAVRAGFSIAPGRKLLWVADDRVEALRVVADNAESRVRQRLEELIAISRSA